MYYSEKVRKQKIIELKDNQAFIKYAQDAYQEHKNMKVIDEDKTFEEYLLRDVFELYDNFTMMQFLQSSDQQTIDKVLTEALKGLDF